MFLFSNNTKKDSQQWISFVVLSATFIYQCHVYIILNIEQAVVSICWSLIDWIDFAYGTTVNLIKHVCKYAFECQEYETKCVISNLFLTI